MVAIIKQKKKQKTRRQENSVSNSIATIYVSEPPKQCTIISSI